MAMNASQQAAAGCAQAIFTTCQSGQGYDDAYLWQLVACGMLLLAQSAGGNAPAVTGSTGLPTVVDNTAIAIPGR